MLRYDFEMTWAFAGINEEHQVIVSERADSETEAFLKAAKSGQDWLSKKNCAVILKSLTFRKLVED